MAHNYTNLKGRVYEIMPYQSEWINRFQLEADNIRSIVGPTSVIEHIGSTSVPGMVAKSCIDILVVVGSIEQVDSYILAMESMGYEYKKDIVMKDARLFRKYHNNKAWVNVHFFSAQHHHVREMLAVRDYLRSNREEVTKYSDLKKSLYEKYPEDYSLYRKHKDEYMADLVRRALEF